MQVNEAYIVSAVRTAVGKAKKGSLVNVRPEYLGGAAVRGALDRVPGLDGSAVDDVVMGCAFPEGPQGMNMARQVSQKAGLPDEVAAVTVNRFCSSGLQTIAQAYNSVVLGQSSVAVAGGVESMSQVPMGGYFFSPDPDLVARDPDLYAAMGITAENVAAKYQISREDQDAFALQSHLRAVDAIESGRFKDEIVPMEIEEVVYAGGTDTETHRFVHDTDEGPRADTTLEALASLKPAFKVGGSVTAGNASQMNDGAAAAVIMSRRMLDETGATPIARLVGFAVHGAPPELMGIGPIEAVKKVLRQTGLGLGEIDLFELNEAFASQSVYCQKELGIPDEKINVNGGAIALGHPLGCTGAKLTATALYELKRRGGKYAVVTMCIGGGQGAAGLFELAK